MEPAMYSSLLQSHQSSYVAVVVVDPFSARLTSTSNAGDKWSVVTISCHHGWRTKRLDFVDLCPMHNDLTYYFNNDVKFVVYKTREAL